MKNEKLTEFENNVKNKKITVIGIGISNIPLIKYLVSLGADVKACDKRDEKKLGKDYDDLKKLGICFSLGDDYLKDIDADIIFKTPGMRFDVPELLAAKEKGAVVTSEMEVFFDICPAKIIAVTGSDGKTTTTTLINNILREEGYKTWLGGNIGNPLLTSVKDIAPDDIVVLELSSFQLHTMKKSPHIAVITNISPNHLDMHKSYEEYIAAKKNIMLYQNKADILVTNADNEVTSEISEEAKGISRSFSSSKDALCCIKNGSILYDGEEIIKTDDIRIPGKHNIENYMAAICALHGIAGKDSIYKVAKNFAGVEHRIEFVRELDGVKYYNSSIDSSPNRTKNTLNVFKEKVILIAGGKDKGIPYDEIGSVILDHVKTLILIGATSGVIEKAVINADINKAKNLDIYHAKDYPDAVNYAKNSASSGDTVILSPASTSFDLFKNFEERGNLFKSIVNSL